MVKDPPIVRPLSINAIRMTASRIVQVASGDLWGGAEACIYQLCVGLRDAGLDVSAVVMNPGELSDRLAATGLRTFVLNERDQSSIELATHLRRMLREIRPDVVHSHRSKENVLAAVASLFARGTRPLLVKTIHGAEEHADSPLWSRRRVAQFAEKALDRAFDARVAVSFDLYRRLCNAYARRKLITIHNGVSPASSSELGSPSHGLHRTVGFAGRLVAVKRIDIILSVARELKKTEGRSVRFEIVGDGPLRVSLQDLARQLQVHDVVQFLGFKNDIRPHLLRWDAAILTSDHEGLPMISLEALAAGIPVIARAVGGLREIVAGPQQGALVDSQDPKLLAAAILETLRKSSMERRVSRLPSQFSSQEMCRRYLALYSDLDENRQTRSTR